MARIQIYLPWRYSEWSLHQRRQLSHIQESFLHSGSMRWGEPTKVLLNIYSLCLGNSRGSKTLPGWPSPDIGAGSVPQGPSNYSTQVEVPAGRLLHPGLRRPNLISWSAWDQLGSLPEEPPSQVGEGEWQGGNTLIVCTPPDRLEEVAPEKEPGRYWYTSQHHLNSVMLMGRTPRGSPRWTAI